MNDISVMSSNINFNESTVDDEKVMSFNITESVVDDVRVMSFNINESAVDDISVMSFDIDESAVDDVRVMSFDIDESAVDDISVMSFNINESAVDDISVMSFDINELAVDDLRMIHDSLSKTILQGTVEGKRKGGRQKKAWCDNIKEWTGMAIYELVRSASDRDARRQKTDSSALRSPRRPHRSRV
ncbi:UDP-glucuronosyltransferase 2A1-like [Elysia marginata]|uniref:UDP-glucuronosyltransferase 2A1-like n=1 Tax=Elysia marginata TaxID=1093978 RepID=A0AAV4H7S8_9GAST|nr:UDP-glucuronosyltransferase 2A1-like [Elysia marginata]